MATPDLTTNQTAGDDHGCERTISALHPDIIRAHILARLDGPRPSGLISAVDIFYQGKLVLSKIEETETLSEWFLCSPFLVELIDPKDPIPTDIRRAAVPGDDDGAWLKHLEENVTLSWILIDPNLKRAANVSSRRPVSVNRHWLTGEIQLRFSTVMTGAREVVQCGLVVTCGGDTDKERGKMHVREVGLHVEDMEGRHLKGSESLVILGNAIEGGGRRKVRKSREGKERYEEYLGLRRESVWLEREERVRIRTRV
ncbi:hypothetical protein G4B88_002998 [Cannabis sativa]|uniref:F-box protein n=1 Tax=Cannabis sativa TaxID=3483 RepID=A0A7J6FMJ5_CANSA|nr:hypothetical protein G4B88_002998 [Cannabis sativa]